MKFVKEIANFTVCFLFHQICDQHINRNHEQNSRIRVARGVNLKNFATEAARNIGSYLWKTNPIYTIISALRIAIFLRKRCRICRKWREAYVKKEYDNLTFVGFNIISTYKK